MAELEGKTVIVTGANAGIGKTTALDMAIRGARVIMACRDKSRGESAAEEVRKESRNDNVVVDILDLASLESVREFAAMINEREERLDILINNAGIMACPPLKTKDGFEMQFGTNHLGHFLLTIKLLDLLKRSAPSRIVNVSSSAHRGGKIQFDDLNLEKNYTPFRAYGQSKLANILFTRTLHEKLEGTEVTTYSLHPGVIKTNLAKHVKDNSAGCFIACCFKCCSCCCKTPEEGAKTTIYCAVATGIEKHSGKYFADSKLTRPTADGEDDEVARRLWEVSEELTNASQ